jgi:hypothetical protein
LDLRLVVDIPLALQHPFDVPPFGLSKERPSLLEEVDNLKFKNNMIKT